MPSEPTLLDLPGAQMDYPKWESSCHGAPVYRLQDKTKKYVCVQCSDYCIPRSKKL